MLLVEHVRCAEHGELVHAEGDAHDDHGWALQGSSSSSLAITSSSSEGGHGHEHCPICFERRRMALVPPAVPELCVSEGGEAHLAHCPEASPRSSGVYSFAPKTSPPV